MSNIYSAISEEPTNWYLLKIATDNGYSLSDLELLVQGALQLKIEDYIYSGLNGAALRNLQMLQKDLKNDGLLVYMNSLPNKPKFLA